MKMNLFPVLKNKYVLTFIVLLVYILFFDKNDILSQLDLTKKSEKLKQEKQYFVDEIEKNKTEMNELKTNPGNLEKFAREKYLMKKDNEDIFVIVEEKDTTVLNKD